MSSIKIVKARLADVLQQALPKSAVIYGSGGAEFTDSKRILVLGGIEKGASGPDSMDAGTESEVYVIDCQISVDVTGSDQRVATEMADDDWTAAKIAIRENLNGHDLGLGQPLQIFPTSEFELREKADTNGRHALIKFGIQVVAQVS